MGLVNGMVVLKNPRLAEVDPRRDTYGRHGPLRHS